MPTHYTRRLATEFADREPLWGWRDDTPEIMRRQIDLAADHGVAFFSFCWYWHDNKGPINIKAIEDDPKHVPMRLFMDAKNNQRMEFCLLVGQPSQFRDRRHGRHGSRRPTTGSSCSSTLATSA